MSGITLLTAVGQQDTWIHAEDKSATSFFSQVWRKHTNFSQNVVKQQIQGLPRAGGLSTVRIEKSGDILGYCYLTIDNNTQARDSADWTSLIESVQWVVGGQVIDEQTSEFSENIAIDMFAQNTSKSSNGPHPGSSSASYFYPLRFAFCENVSAGLPLCAIPLSEVEIRIRWAANAGDYQWEFHSMMYYLDGPEREKVASPDTKNMLIYQVQSAVPSNELVQDLVFNHPVKFIASANTDSDSAYKKTNNRLKLVINGEELAPFKWARPNFLDVSHYYHTNFVTSPDVFMYPFCLNTSMMQPTGSLNCSRIANFKIVSESLNLTDKIYAVSLNILVLSNGVAALRYSN
jgi:hypothetical protein